MKRLVILIVFLIVCFAVYKNSNFILTNIIYQNELNLPTPNAYQRKEDFAYFHTTDDFHPKNVNDILNIIYTALNNGYDKFYYLCDLDYKSCIKDSKDLIANTQLISAINNFIHPYNSFSRLSFSVNNLGKVSIKVDKLYDEEMINTLNEKVDAVIQEVTTKDMPLKEKILAIHDYIINNTVYDVDRNEFYQKHKYYKYHANLAYGPLMEGHAICGGYADAMAIFLDRLNVKNYKISSAKHIWNLVYLDDGWYHLDLTWDDPVLDNQENILTHHFFLISTSELAKLNTNQHDFNKNVYLEAK